MILGAPSITDRGGYGRRSRSLRPAVVETVDFPQSTSDGRASRRASTLWAQVTWFAAIGVVSTAAWAGLYLVLRGALTPLPANALALVVTAVGNTAANRRLTFGVQGRDSLVRDHAIGLVAFALAVCLTSGAAMALDALLSHAGRLAELGVLAIANFVATACRFVLLRLWVGRPAHAGRSPVSFRIDLERIPS
jgi:putative flippase GtrA